MANFCNLKEERITEVTLPNLMDKGSPHLTIGLWGFLDFDGKELQILRPPYVNVSKGAIKGKVRLYDLSSYHPGTWTLEAVVQGADNLVTWDKLTVYVRARKEDWSGDSSQWSQEKKLSSLDPLFRPAVSAVLAALRDQGFQPKIFFGWRSVAVQHQLFLQGRTKVQFSFHNAQRPDGTPNAYAADIVDSRWGWTDAAQQNGFWDALGAEARERGLVWGGDWTSFRDVAHIQSRQNSELAATKRESGL